MSDDSRMAIMAHEIAHAIYKHSFPGASSKIIRFYFSNGLMEPLGSLQVDNSDARELATKWIATAEITGSSHLASQGNIPITEFGNAIFPTIFKSYVKDVSESADPNCVAAAAQWGQLSSKMSMVNKSLIDWSFQLGESDLDFIFQQQRAANASLSKCVLPKRTFKELLSDPAVISSLNTTNAWYGQDVLTSTKDILSEIEPAINGRLSYALGILAITDTLHSRLAQIERDPRFVQLRYFSTEDAADDMAIRITQRLGKPYGVRTWMLETISAYAKLFNSKVDYTSRCKAMLAAKEAPPYGPLLDNHHGPCYRAFHNEQVIESQDILKQSRSR